MARVWIPAVLGVVLVGCGTAGGEPGLTPEHPAAQLDHPVRFEVANGHVLEMRVFLQAGGQRILLGNVPPRSARGFHVPASLLTQFGAPVLHGDLMGSTQGFTSERLDLDAATRTVRWKVKPSGLTRLRIM